MSKCSRCGIQNAHPVYNGKCEDCWVDSTTAAGRRSNMEIKDNSEVLTHVVADKLNFARDRSIRATTRMHEASVYGGPVRRRRFRHE